MKRHLAKKGLVAYALVTAMAMTSMPMTAFADDNSAVNVVGSDKQVEDTSGTEGTNDAEGANDAEGTNDAEGANDAEGTNDAEGSNDAEGADDAEGTNDAEGAEGAEGTNDAEGAEGTNDTEGTESVEGTSGTEESLMYSNSISMLGIAPLSATTVEVDTVEGLKSAINDANANDVIKITESLNIDETIAVNKAITITADEGVILTVGSSQTTFALTNGAVLDGLNIENKDATESVNADIISLASGTAVKNCKFTGNYTDGSNQILRAMATNAGATDFIIENNEIYNLRQPAYIEGNGTISNNYVEGTRGWVVCANYTPEFKGNTFGENVIDIAIISNGTNENTAELTEAISAISENNNGAYVENQVNKASAKDGKYYVDESNANATLAGAIKNAGTTQAEIVLNSDTTGNFVIEEDQNITLDLNGFTIANTAKGHTITNKGILTITDNSTDKTGVIDNTTHATAAVWNEGTAYLNGGTYTRSKENGQNKEDAGGNSYYNIVNHGNMTIEPGVTVRQDGAFSSMIENGWYNGNQNTGKNDSVMVINGGTFIGGLNTIKNDDYGDLTINNGSFENLTQAAVLNWNKTDINGGIFTVVPENTSAIILNGQADDIMDKGILNITGGNFESEEGVPFIRTMFSTTGYTSGSINITGGTITGDIVLTDASEGAVVNISNKAVVNGSIKNSGKASVKILNATVTDDLLNSGSGSVLASEGATIEGSVSNTGSGSITVIKSAVGNYNENSNIVFVDSTKTDGTPIENSSSVSSAVAMIGSKTYESIYDAFAQAKAGDTIRLMQDVTITNGQALADTNLNSAVLTIPDGVTLDGNNKKIIADENWCTTASGSPANHIVGITAGTTATIKDLTIVGNANTKHGVNVYGSKGDSSLAISNVTIMNCGTAGMVINGAKVTATNITTSGNPWGSINVDDNEGSALTLNGGSFSEDVQIWTEYTGEDAEKVKVDGTDLSLVNGVVGEGSDATGFTYFTNDYTKLGTTYNQTTNTVYTSLKEALDNAQSGDEIHVVADAELTESATIPEDVILVVEKGVTLTIAQGEVITNNGSIDNKGTINGEVVNGTDGEVTEYYKITFTSNKTIDSIIVKQNDTTIEPESENGVVYNLANGTYTYELTSSETIKTGSFTVNGADNEIYVKFGSDSDSTSSGSGSSGGGGGSSSSSSNNEVSIENSQNGEVSTNKDSAKEGDEVTVTAKPEEGFVVDKVTITDKDGNEIDVEVDENGEYTFTMPDEDVTISVTFKEDTEDDKEETTEGITEEDTEKTSNFDDVSSSDWFYESVEYVADNNIMNGISDNIFAPDSELTRAMLVQMIYNIEDQPTTNAVNPFTDVQDDQWYTDAIVWANDLDIVSGMGDNIFAPDAEITREQMVVMLYNYAQYKGYDVSKTADLSIFTDKDKVSSWAEEAVKWAVAEGFISGMGDGTIAPQNTATRAEIASLIMRFNEANK